MRRGGAEGPPVALVTGANPGIGFEVCRQLARRGHAVFLGSRDAAKGEAAAGSLRGERGTVLACRLDVTNLDRPSTPGSRPNTPVHTWSLTALISGESGERRELALRLVVLGIREPLGHHPESGPECVPHHGDSVRLENARHRPQQQPIRQTEPGGCGATSGPRIGNRKGRGSYLIQYHISPLPREGLPNAG